MRYVHIYVVAASSHSTSSLAIPIERIPRVASSVTYPTSSTQRSLFTILFAPAHVMIDDSRDGSEYHLPYKLMERLALDFGVRIIALTVQAHVERPLPNVQFVSVNAGGSLPVTNQERLLFHLRVAATARRILAETPTIDLIQHMYPFGFRATFNLLALLRRRTDPPVIIGPLQAPLSFVGSDETGVAVRDFSEVGKPPSRHRRAPVAVSTLVTTPVLATLSTQTLRRAAALVTYSERTSRLYQSLIGPKSMSVIPPGIDTQLFSPRDEDADPARAVEEGRREIVIVAVGYLVQRKAFDILIKSVAELVRRDLPVHLRLVGDGPARNELENLARQLGIEKQVTFTGLVPHDSIAHEYHKADIFCSTSLSESFSLVGLEAMACGLPVVATPTGFFRDALQHGQAGILVGFGAVGKLAEALALLIQNPSMRQALGLQGRELAVQEYDWRVIAQRYMSLYHHVVPHANWAEASST